ncbi:MAG: hypothetical protein ACK5P5_14660 [Pseudobdellovibrionaceae bacterium]
MKMLKKTTIYLEDTDIEKLKVLSLVLKTSMTDLIRKGIENFYTTLSDEEKAALKALSKISLPSKKSDFSEGKSKKSPQQKGNGKRK